MIERLRNTWLFRRQEMEWSPLKVILWWELRRIPYNIIVGFIACFFIFLTYRLRIYIYRDIYGDNPYYFLGEVIHLVLYGLLANICYTCGWILELTIAGIWKNLRKSFDKIVFLTAIIIPIGIILLLEVGTCAQIVLTHIFPPADSSSINLAVSNGNEKLMLTIIEEDRRTVSTTVFQMDSKKHCFEVSPLVVAAQESLRNPKRYFRISQILLDAGADVNFCKGFHTPLSIAASYGDIQLVNLFISRGAKINMKGYEGKTPLHYATQGISIYDPDNKQNFYNRPIDKTVIEALLNHGADVNALDDSHHTPLYYVIQAGHTEIAELLKSKGAINQ